MIVLLGLEFVFLTPLLGVPVVVVVAALAHVDVADGGAASLVVLHQMKHHPFVNQFHRLQHRVGSAAWAVGRWA